jgi:hypothetical protein
MLYLSMENKNLLDPFVQKPTLTADGRPWVQRCYVCLKSVDFIRMKAGAEYLHVGQYVRHKRCYPPTIK